jgi:hypothetical protein
MMTFCVIGLVNFHVQYNEYPASVLSDKEKEINALKETETHQLKEDKFCNKLLEGEVVCLFGFGNTIYYRC